MSADDFDWRIHVDHPVKLVHGDRSFQIDLDPNRPDFRTSDGVDVWLKRPKGQRTWFEDTGGTQVGPIHANFVPAIIWAHANGWVDPTDPAWWSDAVLAEILAGGAPDDQHTDAGAWVPS